MQNRWAVFFPGFLCNPLGGVDPICQETSTDEDIVLSTGRVVDHESSLLGLLHVVTIFLGAVEL